MKFGLQHASFTYDGNGPAIVESVKRLSTRAESLGFDSFWVPDHFHQVSSVGRTLEPMLESWTTQAVMAGLTSKIKLGTLVSGIVYRYPSVLAKIAASLDVLSKGRLFMGIGAAWNVEESTAYGIPFPPVKERMRRLDEAVQIIRKMWTEQPASFNGRFYQIREAYCNPKPIQEPHPPIMIGGDGERQTLKIVAKYADACNIIGSPETVRRKLTILRDHCKAVERDYGSIQKTKLSHVIIDKNKGNIEKRVAEALKKMSEDRLREYVIYGTPEEVQLQVEALRDAGIEYLIVNLEPERELEALELFAGEVARRF